MPDAMRKDVEKLMEDGPAQRKQPERFTRKEQAARDAAIAAAGPDVDSAAASGAPAGADSAAEDVGGVRSCLLLQSRSCMFLSDVSFRGNKDNVMGSQTAFQGVLWQCIP